MAMGLSNRPVSPVMAVIAGARAARIGVLSLLRPAALRRAQSGVARLITVVAGH